MKKNIHKFIIFIAIALLVSTSSVTAKNLDGWINESGNIYYYANGVKLKDFQEIEGKTYFFSNVNSTLKTGLQGIEGKLFYLNSDGTVYYGWKTLDKNTYYFGNDGFAVKGFQEIVEKTYFFSNVNSTLKTGLQGIEGKLFYLNPDGTVYHGWKTIAKNKYYFGTDHYALKGKQQIADKTYIFSDADSTLQTGWKVIDTNKIYLNADGSMTFGWKLIGKDKYYFDTNGYAVKGFQEIAGKTYFFSNINNILKTGWQGINGKLFFLDENGVLFEANGWTEMSDGTRYFENNFALKGIQIIDNRKYYFDEGNGVQYKKTTIKNNKEYIISENGEFDYIQYLPVYYSQKDSRWLNINLGLSTIGKTGCAPTSMAMAFEAILGRKVLPTEVANYLYYNTDQYNKRLSGTSGKGIVYAADYFGVTRVAITSKEHLINELKKGHLIFAAMANGKFATPKWNHAIILYGYDAKSNTTQAMDPLTSLNNGKVSIETVWNEQSRDPDDLTGGGAFHALSE